MADAALFVGWDRPVTGKEKNAIELFQGWMGYLKKLQSDGSIESFEPVLLQAHGGDLNGFCLVRGERKKLDEVCANEEWRTWMTRGIATLHGFGEIPCFIGAGVNKELDLYRKAL